MIGMHANTGRVLADLDHLAQSIRDILTTPEGTLPMRRNYGSLLPALLDHPFNATNRVRLFGAVAQALRRWETRLRLQRVDIALQPPATFVVTIEGHRTDLPARSETVRLSIPITR